MPGERRKFKRIELLNEVSYEANRSEILAQWTDISTGGIFVQAMAPLTVGEQSKLRIHLDESPKGYRAVGVVRHSLKYVGMGLEFTQLHPVARDLIQEEEPPIGPW